MNKKEARIVFIGTPDISSYVLECLIKDGYNIVGVITQPDRPVGRKQILEPTPVRYTALKYNLQVFQPEKIRREYDFINLLKPDLILTLAYGQILPEALLKIPPYGCLNLHGSLLPKYRGAAPIQYSLINNDEVTGMSLMEMVKEMDAGRVYATKELKILDDDNCTSLFNKLGEVAYQLVDEKLQDYLDDKLVGVEQDASLVTFAPMITKEEEHLDLSKPKEHIYGYIRALSDNPGGYLNSPNGKIKILRAKIISDEVIGKVGEIVKSDKEGIYLQTINGLISLLELQKEGKKRMSYRDFINGNQSFLHTVLD